MIDLTVVNGQKIKCEIKGEVNIKLQGGSTVKLNDILYSPQSVKNIMSVSKLIWKGSTMGATKYKVIIKKSGVNMNLDARKVKNESTMFLFEAKRYVPEV